MKEIKTIPELWKWINNGYEGQYRVKSYYHCKAVEGSKSHKFEQYRSSGRPCYEFERIAQESRSKIFSFFLSSRVPKTFSSEARERMAYVITNKHNISGIVKPQGINSTNPKDVNVWYGYGDVLPRGRGGERLLDYSHGEDMLIFRVANDLSKMEIFVLDVRAISESRPQDRPRAYKGKKQNIPRTDILQLFIKGRFDREVRNLRSAAYYLKKRQEAEQPQQKNINFDDDNGTKCMTQLKCTLTPCILKGGI